MSFSIHKLPVYISENGLTVAEHTQLDLLRKLSCVCPLVYMCEERLIDCN